MIPEINPFTPEDKLEKTYDNSTLKFLIAGYEQPSSYSVNGNYEDATYLNH